MWDNIRQHEEFKTLSRAPYFAAVNLQQGLRSHNEKWQGPEDSTGAILTERYSMFLKIVSNLPVQESSRLGWNRYFSPKNWDSRTDHLQHVNLSCLAVQQPPPHRPKATISFQTRTYSSTALIFSNNQQCSTMSSLFKQFSMRSRIDPCQYTTE